MNKELELKLVEKYPKILQDYNGDKMKTCMHWGMECGDGWYDLLDKLMAKLDYISNVSGIQVVADQIKEKFGTLRFYYHTVANTDLNVSDCVEDIISDVVYCAEHNSKYTCEVTGKEGVLCSRVGWLKTLCKNEADIQGYAPTDPKTAKYWDEVDNKSISNEK